MSSTSHDLAACLTNFPLASRSSASACRALHVFGHACVCLCRHVCASMNVCLCLFGGFHLWYSHVAPRRQHLPIPVVIHQIWTGLYLSFFVFRFIYLCGRYVLSILICAVCHHMHAIYNIYNWLGVSPCSPRRHARRSGSLTPCLSTPGTPGWGGWSSLLGPVLFHTLRTTDWRPGSTCLQAQQGR